MNDKEFCKYMKMRIAAALKKHQISKVTAKYDYDDNGSGVSVIRAFKKTDESNVREMLGLQNHPYERARVLDARILWPDKDREYRDGKLLDIFSFNQISLESALETFIIQYLHCYENRIDWKEKRKYRGKINLRFLVEEADINVKYKIDRD